QAVFVDNRPKDGPPTAEEIQEYLELEEQRKALAREADAIAKQTSETRERILAFVKEKAGKRKSKSITHEGFLLAIVNGKRNVKWKDAFIAALGPEAAAEVQENTPASEVLEVTTA